jgi:aminoglycoside 6'-N-acetyltransferase I
LKIERCASVEQLGWLLLRETLWPHSSREQHLVEMAGLLAQSDRFLQLMAYDDAQQPVGLVEASIRIDYVNGTESSPVAFLEGIYVTPSRRRRGFARKLVSAIVEWALANGCREIASDAALENEASHRFHESLGFCETERVVYFRKVLVAD